MRIALAAATLALAISPGFAPAMADDIDYQAAGKKLTGYFAAANEPKGLVLIVHDWNGVDGYERRRADMLAKLGYDAFVLDMFGAATRVETDDERRAATDALYKDRELMRGLATAGMAQARALCKRISGASQPHVGCFRSGVSKMDFRSMGAGTAALPG